MNYIRTTLTCQYKDDAQHGVKPADVIEYYDKESGFYVWRVTEVDGQKVILVGVKKATLWQKVKHFFKKVTQ